MAFPTRLLAHANTGARFAVRGLLDVLLPPNCATCDQPVAIRELVENWFVHRDNREWDQFLEVWHEERSVEICGVHSSLPS